MPTKITVLGGGAMATACSVLLAENPGQRVSLWIRTPAHAEEMAKTRENARLLPGVTIPDFIDVTSDIDRNKESRRRRILMAPTT